ncbi:hypothetical protein K438DRAFT_102142 [Mycena galopus ATCC 62051]|nr:hypothetical protein K438DRAFT_102142 [Mycena galopus ATCC 62051]
MSSRAASGRKRLRPAQTASPSLSPLPESMPIQSVSDAYNRREVDPRTHYTSSPQAFRAHNSLPGFPPPSSTLTSSGHQFPSMSQPSRDYMHGHEAAPELTPYPPPSEFQPYQLPRSRREKAVHFRAINAVPETPSFHPSPAPSYETFSPGISDSEDSQPTSRALPPYPSPPPGHTGWAALSDTKIASAIAVPPRYPDSEDEHSPYPSPPHSLASWSSVSRTESVASSSRPPPSEWSVRARSGSEPPHYSPSSSPSPVPHSRLPIGAGAISPLQQPNRFANSYSHDAAYMTPQASASSFSSSSLASEASFSTMSSDNRQHLYRIDSSLSGSSGSNSGGSPRYSARAGNPAMESSQSVSTNSSSGRSGGSDPPAPPTPTPTLLAGRAPPSSPFVFPSSRSRMRPSNTTGAPRFKFRGKRKPKGQMENAPGLAPIPAEGGLAQQRAPRVPPPSTANTNFRPVRPPQNLGHAATPSTGSGSSGSSGAVPPPTFYFPGSRTRSHPKTPTQFALGKTKKPGFLRLGLNSKNKKVDSTAPPPEHEQQPYQQQIFSIQAASPDDEQCQTPMPQSYDEYEYDASNRESTVVEPPSPQVVTKIGTYPLDAYDAGLIETDRQTAELLRKVISTNSPSFHNYGGRPPHTVLDLGCGAGHWLLDAAVAWRNSGSQIVGFDMVDTTKGMWPSAQRQGVADNIKFVRGNFVKQPLPFPDGSFQLVRMASLALCIPHEKWEFVLDQVWRVLAVGGRLEFIDDQVFFPYGTPPQLNPHPQQTQSSSVPTLDTMIPSTGFSRMSLADVVNPNTVRDDTDSQIYDLYGVEEEQEDEYSDADTIASGRRRGAGTPMPHTRSSSRSTSRSASSSLQATQDPEAWREQAAASRELEALFEDMMNMKFGIHLRPSEFVGEVLMRVFGGVREMMSLHLTLAPPEQAPEGQGGSGNQRPPSVRGLGRFERAQAAAGAAVMSTDDSLGQCPGLILWPSTFIPMQLPELEAHVSKHLRVLLSCKSALIDYAAEIADRDEDGDAQGEAAMEALWEYQNFLRERFNPPPDDPSRSMSDSSSVDDANSIHHSIFSVSSVGTEALDAMREYRNELTRRFEMPSEQAAKPVRGSARDAPMPTPTPPRRSSVAESTTSSNSSGSTSSVPNPNPDRPRKSRSRGSRGRDRSSAMSSLAPPYSRIELTHVRTFYVYEAVKQAQNRFQAGGRLPF